MECVINPEVLEKVITSVTAWLIETKPVEFTGRKNTALNARPLALFQSHVATESLFWFSVFRYAPERGKMAGSKAPIFPIFRQALPEALRRFRSAVEGIPLESVPRVEYSSRHNQTTKSGETSGRAIIGFEVRQTVSLEPTFVRNPHFDELQGLPIDKDMCALRDNIQDNSEVDQAYFATLTAAMKMAASQFVAAGMSVNAASTRQYKCGKCGQLKGGHVCLQAKKRKAPSAAHATKRVRK